MVVYAVLLSSYYQDVAIPVGERFTNGAYNLLVIIFIGMLARLAVGEGTRNTAWRLLAVGTAGVLANEFAIVLSTVGVDWATPARLVISPLAFAMGTCAILHPAAYRLTEPPVESAPVMSKGRLFLLALTLVIVPVTLALTLAFGFDSVSVGVLAVGALILPILTLLRTKLLLDSNHEVSRLNLSLSESGRKLLGSSSVAEAVEASVPATATVLGADRSFVMSLLGSEGNHVVSSPGLVPSPRPIERDDAVAQMKRLSLVVTDFAIGEKGNRGTLSVGSASQLKSVEVAAVETLTVQVAQAISSAEAADTRAERRFRALVQNASDLVVVISEDETVAYMSEAAERVTGYPASEFEGRSLEWVIHPADWETARNHTIAVAVGAADDEPVEIRTISPDGSNRLFECELTDMRHIEGVEGVVINATDVTDRRKLEIDLYNAATTDSLTLLLNRQAFTEVADTAVRRGTISKTATAVAILNLDEFGFVNGSLGQAHADQVLIEVGHAIRRAVRIDDSVARLNGDEFAILMPGGYGTNDAVATIERVIEEIAKPIEVAGQTVSIGASAGLVVDADPEATGASLLRNADTAMDLAKHHQRGTVVLYDESMGEEASERIEIRNSLENSIDNGELRLVYQPIVNMETGEISSMESLSRWHHPVRGPIAPDTFIPIAESSGFIETLGDWVFETVCQQVNEWDDQGIDGFTVSVNMSGHQLRNDDTTTKMRRVLKRTGADPSRIVIEITESVLIDDTEFIADRLRALREMGLKLAIDDFGTGYSSLSYLQRYEFDVLKIDRSFVRDIDEEKNSRRSEIIRAIVSLAKGLGAVTVAEGVEDNDERQQLAELGCDLAQGYLFYYPMELPEMNRVLATARDSALAA